MGKGKREKIDAQGLKNNYFLPLGARYILCWFSLLP